MTFEINGGTNPLLLYGNQSPLSTKVYTATTEGYLIEGKYDGWKPTLLLKGVLITVSLVEPSSYEVYTETMLTWTFNPIITMPTDTHV
jgi:hypothetical protein